MVDPVSSSFTLVTAFKDAYLTAKFIHKTALTVKDYRGEQSRLVVHFNVQIVRLKNLSRLFRGIDGNKVDMKLLETVPDQYLKTVRDVLAELQSVLAAYSKLAATLDEDYKKYSPLSPYFKFDPSKDTLYIDDIDGEIDAEEDVENLDNKPERKMSEMKGKKKWAFLGFLLGGSDSKAKRPFSKHAISLKSLPPGVQWLFTKGELEQTLKKFEEWNTDLEFLIGPLLSGFGFYENKDLQQRLQADENVNIFQGHIELSNLAAKTDYSQDSEGSKVNLLTWKDAQSEMSKYRILVEYKKTPTSLNLVSGGNEGAGSSDIRRQIMELYAPQLARFLRTAGEHSFRTLPFNSYAWDPENFEYAFLFNYPANSGNHEPKSLNDCILSSRREPQFKLELKQRFHIAYTMAQSVGAFHSDGWLHKSICSHAIKFFFEADNKKCDFRNPYLTTFEFSRPVAGVTRLATRAVNVDEDIYRHPDRYGPPSAGFSKIHDIYSLGVVLLEIGLWQTARQIYDEIVKYELKGHVPSEGVLGKKIKTAFLEDAKERLAHRMGSSYQEAVILCLNGDWDQFVDRRDFADEFQRRVVQKVDIKAFLN